MLAIRLIGAAALAGVLLGATVLVSRPWNGPVTFSQTPLHDARLQDIDRSSSVHLSPGQTVTAKETITVRNEGDHPDTIGVYVDVFAPGASAGSNPFGCTPHGRVLQTNVALNANQKAIIKVDVAYSCADPVGANGQTYTWMAVADHGADDLASCGVFQIQSQACFAALADDDDDDGDNRVTTSGPRVLSP